MTGFAITPLPKLAHPRIDVTVRISGAFRDTFPSQVALLDAAARAVAMLDEPDEWNEPAAARRRGEAGARVFGAAPGRYGAAVADRALDGHWTSRDELGAAYLAASSHAYGGPEGAGHVDDSFSARIRTADAFVHVSDTAGRDILEASSAADVIGGLAAAAQSLGAAPALYSLDSSNPETPKARTVAEDIARIVHGRLTHPRWIASHLAHGWRGAAELAEAVDTLFVFAASTTPSPTGCSTRSSRPGAPMPRSGPRSRPPMPRPRRRSARGWRRRRGAACGRAGATRWGRFWRACPRRGRRRNERAFPRHAPARLVPEHAQADGNRRWLAGAAASARRAADPGAVAAHRGAGARHGNGLIEISARGNMQLRGVTAGSHPALVATLLAERLVDEHEGDGPQRLTLVSPLAQLGCHSGASRSEEPESMNTTKPQDVQARWAPLASKTVFMGSGLRPAACPGMTASETGSTRSPSPPRSRRARARSAAACQVRRRRRWGR